MVNYVLDPNMGFRNPIVGQEQGPDYASDVSGALTTIGAHRHTGAPSDGQQIGVDGILIDGDLSLQNSNNLTNAKTVRFAPQIALPGASGDVGELVNLNGDVWWINGAGVGVQITSGSGTFIPSSANITWKYQSAATNTTILPSDDFVILDVDTSSIRSVALPSIAAVPHGRRYVIHDKTGNAATNNITINRNGTDTIEGATSYVINANYGSVIISSNGVSSWNLIHQIMKGDLSGVGDSTTVIKINGSTVPVGGSLTTGNVLQVSGAAALSYGAVNLAGGAGYITGSLPTANQVVQSMGGDVSGTTASATVAKINGNAVASGTPTNGQVLTYSTGSSQWVAQDISSGAVTLAGDVTGAANANTVVKINGATVPAAGSLTTGHVHKVSGASATTYGFILNANVDPAAAIVYSKLNLGTSIVNADINASAAIAYSKLNLASSIVSADIVDGTIVNVDINASAAIDGTKVSPVFGAQAVTTSTSVSAPFFTSSTANPASTGLLRGVNNTVVASARNAANSGNITLLNTDASNFCYMGAGSAGVNLGNTTAQNVIQGAVQHTTRTITTDTTIDTTTFDYIIIVNYTGTGTIVLTLPTPTAGRIIKVYDKGPLNIVGGGALSIHRHASEKINTNANSYGVAVANFGFTIASDGTDWFLEGKYA